MIQLSQSSVTVTLTAGYQGCQKTADIFVRDREYFLAKIEGKIGPTTEHAKRQYMCDLPEYAYTCGERSLHWRVFSVALCIAEVKKRALKFHILISIIFWD